MSKIIFFIISMMILNSRLVSQVSHEDYIWTIPMKGWNISFSINSNHIACHQNISDINSVIIVDANNGSAVDTIPNQTDPVYTPDGKYLATVSKDTLKLWDSVEYTLIEEVILDREIGWYAFSNDMKYLANPCGGYGLYIYDTKDWKLIHHLTKFISWDDGCRPKNPAAWSVDFTYDNKYFVFSGHESLLYDLENAHLERTYFGIHPKCSPVENKVITVNFFCNNYQPSWDGFYFYQNESYMKVNFGIGGLFLHEFSNNGNFVVIFDHNNIIWIWDVNKTHVALEIEIEGTKYVPECKFSKDDKYLAISTYDSLKLLKIEEITKIEIQENQESSYIKIFPNPVVSMANIEYTIDNAGLVDLSITDIFGRRVKSIDRSDYYPGKYSKIIYSDDLNAGVYFISLKQNDNKIVKKIIVKK